MFGVVICGTGMVLLILRGVLVDLVGSMCIYDCIMRRQRPVFIQIFDSSATATELSCRDNSEVRPHRRQRQCVHLQPRWTILAEEQQIAPLGTHLSLLPAFAKRTFARYYWTQRSLDNLCASEHCSNGTGNDSCSLPSCPSKIRSRPFPSHGDIMPSPMGGK